MSSCLFLLILQALFFHCIFSDNVDSTTCFSGNLTKYPPPEPSNKTVINITQISANISLSEMHGVVSLKDTNLIFAFDRNDIVMPMLRFLRPGSIHWDPHYEWQFLTYQFYWVIQASGVICVVPLRLNQTLSADLAGNCLSGSTVATDTYEVDVSAAFHIYVCAGCNNTEEYSTFESIQKCVNLYDFDRTPSNAHSKFREKSWYTRFKKNEV